jgi:CubicO group peptidase (beta-lactamase class C family)
MRLIIAALMLLTLAGCSRPGDPATGDALLADWTRVLSDGDRASIESFISRHSLNASADDMLAWQDETGGVEVIAVTERVPGKIGALLRTRNSDQLERVALEFDDGQPARITGFTYLLADRPVDQAIGRLGEAAALAEVAAHGDRLAAVDQYAGTLLIARNGEVLLERHWGLADRDSGVPANADTRYRHGSLDKAFTAVAALRQVEQGVWTLDSKLGEVLPDYPNTAMREVTLRQLLAHRAGAGEIFGPEFFANRADLRGINDYIQLYGQREPEFSPGSEFRYSNYGYILIGAMLEQAHGRAYHDIVNEEVFARAGMSRSGALPESETVEGRATGYQRTDLTWTSNAEILPWRGTAAGGGYSTARDLLVFAEALREGHLLGSDTLAQATTAASENDRFGLGLMLTRGNEPTGYGHDGGAPGMSAFLRIFPETGYVVIALSNLDPPRANWLGDTFVNRMPLETAEGKDGGVVAR